MSTNPSSSLRSFLLIATLAFSAGAAGCHLYLEDGYEPPPQDNWPEDCWDCGGVGIDAGTFPGSDCAVDEGCAPGCFCSDANRCEESGFCDAWTACSAGFVCDDDRSTCTPVEPEPVPEETCQSEVTCDVVAPNCPAATTPVIKDGCYTLGCMPKDECPDGAPFYCSDFNANEDACIANAWCRPVYKGVNCTSPSGGVECTSGAADCTCESFELDRCVPQDP